MNEVLNKAPSILELWAKHAMHAGHFSLIEALTSDDTLVADVEVQEVLQQLLPSLSCNLETPSKVRDRLGFSGRIIVLTRKREYQLVRKLRRFSPEATVLSFVYDILPSLKVSAGELCVHTKSCNQVAPELGFLLSSPCSESEWFSEVLEGAGLRKPVEYLDRIMMLWLRECEGFLPLRYFAAIWERLEAPAMLEIHFKTDVLGALLACSWVSHQRLVSWIWAAQPKVIYFTRRDKFAQTCVALAKKQSSKFLGVVYFGAPRDEEIVELADAFSVMHEILVQESQLEELLETADEDFRLVTYEELIDSPLPVLRNLFAFKRRRLPKIVNLPHHTDLYLANASLRGRAFGLRKQAIKRFGLRKNEHGSFTTEFEGFLTTEYED